MRQRLTIAFIGVALSAIILVGAGVLFFSRIGARAEARADVQEQVEAVVDLIADADSPERLGPVLERAASAFEIDELRFVVVANDGSVSTRPTRDNRQPPELFRLDEVQLADFLADETITLDRDERVAGLRQLQLDFDPAGPRAPLGFGLLISQEVAPVPRSAVRWFLISALAVLGLSLLVAFALSRRLVAPIADIEHVTTQISQGELDARVDVQGDDELAQLGRAVNQMAADLGRSRSVEQQFLLSVSHDLRTPLTAIRGYAEALVDGAVDDPARAGEIVRDHADRLERLVRDLLDLARLDARSFRIETTSFDVTDLAEETVAGLEPIADGHDIELVVTGNPGVMAAADRDRVGQILANLVENGLKFADSRVDVAVRPDADCVVVDVSDDGPGIADEDLPHVFERLYVTQAVPRREESSSGLGLAIVRELAIAMGGTVSATNQQGESDGSPARSRTVMTVRLPRHR